MTIKEAILWGFEQLTPTSDSARVDAELLLAHTLKKPTTFLLIHDEQNICSFLRFGRNDKIIFFPLLRYKRLIQKRKQGIPVAYLVGHKEFYLLDFKVNRHVLVPRPDTETLVEAVIEYIRGLRSQDSGVSLKLIDIGIGSGCIPISILKNIPELRAIGTDISWRALRVAKANAHKHGVGDRIQLVWSDLLENIDPTEFEDTEVILTANLPYLPDKMEVKPELGFEPSIALYGGEDGMDVYKKFVQQLARIRPKAVFLELYEWQIAQLQIHLQGYELKYSKTMSGDARCLMLERKSN